MLAREKAHTLVQSTLIICGEHLSTKTSPHIEQTACFSLSRGLGPNHKNNKKPFHPGEKCQEHDVTRFSQSARL
eukprot:4751685-Amphidinium_carterae.1